MAFAKCQEQFYNWFAPIRLPKKSMTNYCKFCLYPEQKLRTQPNKIPREDASPPPSGPTPLGPHCFWVVVCAVCAALLLLVAAFPCCLCSCCGLLLPLFLLLLVLVAVFGPPTRRTPPFPPLQCLTVQNVINNFLQPVETNFGGIPPKF